MKMRRSKNGDRMFVLGQVIISVAVTIILLNLSYNAVVVVEGFVPRTTTTTVCATSSSIVSSLNAAPRRLEDNVDGPLYVNEKCINCAACSMFAPTVFQRRPERDNAHVVYSQPKTKDDIANARAALAACPVAAIRVETNAYRNHNNMDPLTDEESTIAGQLAINPKFNGLPKPFPRSISSNAKDVYFVGHHNEKSFGATPYLFHSKQYGWIMVDTPKYSKSSVEAVESVMKGSVDDDDDDDDAGDGTLNYLILTHVDDTAGHNDWKNHYPNLKRVFHAGDLGRHNWIGDKSLEDVEVLLKNPTDTTTTATRTAAAADDDNAPLPMFDLDGNVILNNDDINDHEVLILHTPGHSPGSISIWKRPMTVGSDDNDDNASSESSATTTAPGILFTGDTYSYTTRDGGRMTGFPRYGNDRKLQAKTIAKFFPNTNTDDNGGTTSNGNTNDSSIILDWQIIAPGHGHVRDYTLLVHDDNDDDNDLMKMTMMKDPKIEVQHAIEELSRW